MNRVKAVFFDVDGTLLDTSEFIFQAFEHSFKTHGLSSVARGEMAKQIGKPLSICYQLFTSLEEVGHLMESHNLFQSANIHLAVPFPNTRVTLRKLKQKNIDLAVISARTRKSLLNTLTIGRIAEYFDVIYTPDEIVSMKPHPEAVIKALDYFKLKPEDALMVGDTISDIQAGMSAGVKTVAAAYGFHGKEIEQVNPNFVIYDIKELLSIVSMPIGEGVQSSKEVSGTNRREFT